MSVDASDAYGRGGRRLSKRRKVVTTDGSVADGSEGTTGGIDSEMRNDSGLGRHASKGDVRNHVRANSLVFPRRVQRREGTVRNGANSWQCRAAHGRMGTKYVEKM